MHAITRQPPSHTVAFCCLRRQHNKLIWYTFLQAETYAFKWIIGACRCVLSLGRTAVIRVEHNNCVVHDALLLNCSDDFANSLIQNWNHRCEGIQRQINWNFSPQTSLLTGKRLPIWVLDVFKLFLFFFGGLERVVGLLITGMRC